MELNLLEYDIDSIKSILQGILDKHLPEGQQISIQELDEQGIVWLIQLLLEKDDKKREQLWLLLMILETPIKKSLKFVIKLKSPNNLELHLQNSNQISKMINHFHN